MRTQTDSLKLHLPCKAWWSWDPVCWILFQWDESSWSQPGPYERAFAFSLSNHGAAAHLAADWAQPRIRGFIQVQWIAAAYVPFHSAVQPPACSVVPWCGIWKSIALHWQNLSECYVSRWELLQWPVEAWADIGHQEIPASQRSLKGTIPLKKRKERQVKALDLQSHLPKKRVAEGGYRRNALFLIIKTNADFLKGIIDKPSNLALLSRKKGWGLDWASHFIYGFFCTSLENVCSSHLPAAPLAPMAVHPAAELGEVAAPAKHLPVGKIWAWQALKWKGRSGVSVEQCYLNSDVWETSPCASLNTFWCFIQTNDVQRHHMF